MGVVLHIVGQAVVDDVSEVLHVQAARCHVGGNEKLHVVVAELLHRQIALLLREFAVQRFRIVAVTNEMVRHFLRFHSRAAKDDGIDSGEIVHDTLQGDILVFGLDEIVDVVDVFSTFVSRADDNFLIVSEVVFGDALNFFSHGGGKEERVSFFGHAGKNLIDAFGKAHVQHFVGFVQHNVFDRIQARHTAVHQINQTTRCRHDDLSAFLQVANLTFNATATIDRNDMQMVNVARVVFQVSCNLQTKFTRRTQNDCLRALVVRPYLLQNGKTESSGFSCSGLRQGDDVISDTQ